MKRLLTMKATLVLLLLALGWSMPTQAKNIYLKPTSWITGSEEFALYSWGGTQEAGWVNFVVVDATNNVYKATIADDRTGMVFGRMNPSRSENNFVWGNIWNKSSDLSVPTDDNILYTITEGRWGIGESGENGAIADGDGLTTEDYTEPVAAGYTVDFNTAITTSNHDFAVAKGWSHIVPNSDYDGYGPYYMSYSYYASMGVDGTGALWAGRQYAGDNSGGEVVKDILVTPLVNGTITLDVKAYSNASSSNPAFVEVYAINADGTLGSLLKTVKEDIAAYNGTGTADWATFTLAELTAEQKLGLRCQYVYIDNFTAASVNIPAERKLEVTKVANLEGATGTSGTTTYFEQQADGTLKVQLQVTLTNTGDYDFAVGDEGYTLTLASASSASGTKTYYDDATVDIPEALAAGESKTIDVDFFIPFSTGWKYFFVRENITGTTSSSNRYAGVTAYESKFVFREKGSTSTSSLTVASWGTISESTTKEYEVANLGTAPLTITSYTQPEGFTLGVNLTSLPEGVTVDMVNQTVTVAGGASVPFTVTQDASATGTYTGTLSIGYKNFGSEEATNYTLNFSATVIGANTWFADFNTITSSSTNYPEGSVAESGIRFGTTYVADANYDGYLYSYTSSSYASANNKFITPKLHANAGDKLAFDIRRDESGSSTYNLKVYISTDRKTWGDPVYSVTAADLTSAFQTKEISFDTEGDYYVAFAIYGVCVDNLIGLEKVDVAHDLYIKSVSWPNASIKSGTAQTKPSIDFIPLTNETADSYTVKYVCGETVLGEGTPVALTASANSSKEIAINWTPNVESTTTFEGTKVVFEFTDDTKVETETFDLTVTNEPIFHFVKTLPSSKWYEPTDYTTPITFGKTNTADLQTFYINNWGSAPLTVKSITLPVGFTTSVETPLTVAAFNGETDGIAAASQALDIIFSATEAGEYSGDMVITYVNAAGEDATFTLAISGTKLDPNAWYANFGTSENQWPAGASYQDGVSTIYVASGDYAITVQSSTASMFVTPKLKAEENGIISFDAKLYNSSWTNGKVVVYAAASREEVLNAEEGTTRTQLFSVSGQDAENAMTTDYQTFNVNVPVGEWYLGFEISGRPYVDELYGLKLADVAHDWMIASSNIPTEAMQNVASTASVNILNLGLQDEAADDITVTAYVNGEAVATGEGVAIPMNHKLNDAGTKLSVQFRYPQVGTFPVYLEVKAGDYSVKTEAVDVTFAEEVAVAGVQVGTKSTTSTNVPFYTTWMDDDAGKSMADIIYTPEQLATFGINAGAKIKSITFVGVPSGTKTINSLTTDVWIAQQAVSDFTAGSPSIDDMTHVNIHNAESVQFTYNSVYEFKIDLSDNPIVYDGASGIRIYTNINGNGQYQSINFDVDGNYQYAYYAHGTGSFTKTSNPVAFFELEASAATLAGNVRTSAGAGIANATVTLKAENGVEYSATSDAEGNYSMNVVQGGLDFTATVEAEGFLKREFAENLGGESKTLDVVMYKKYGILGNIPGFDWDNDVVMTQDEENPMVFTLVKDVVVETAGEYYYKMRADGAWAGNEEGQLAHGYELPASGNNTVKFPSAGTYVVTFTADVDQHSLDAEVALKTFTLAENACEEGQPNIFEITSEIANLTVVRTFNAGWNAVVLPFALTQEEVTTTFGEGSKVAYFNGDTDDANGNVTVKFDELTGDLDANVPYMIYVATATTNPTFNNKTFVDPHGADLKAEVLGTAFDFMGTYVNLDVNAGDMFVSGGKFKTATTNNKVRAFRAYLKSKTEGARQVNIFVDGEEISIATPTAIDGIDVDNVGGNVYNINGQRVNKNVKHGVYIINGKKVVRK